MKTRKEPIENVKVMDTSPIISRLNSLLFDEGFSALKAERIYHRDWNLGLTVSSLEYTRGENERVYVNIHESIPF